ncbi:MAG TPA: HAD family phosphatase [Vicinamibacterales bacterium]|nr:HAD family phosphatase [Vicinamibacterales bacterium]
MSALQAIVLDFDGVVANSERLHLLAFQQALTRQASPVVLTDAAYYQHYLGFDDLGVFKALGQDAGAPFAAEPLRALVAEKERRYEALAAAGEMLFPGVGEFIRGAAARVPLAIASGALTREIENVLAQAGLQPCFLAVVGADQTANSKPSPDPYLEAFARMQAAAGRALDPRRTVAIEDSHWGLESARAAGLRTVAVTNTYPAEALTGHAELVVASLGTLALATLDHLCAQG